MIINKNNLNRRDFIKTLSGAGIVSLTQSPYEFLTRSFISQNFPQPSVSEAKRLSWKAYRGIDFEGSWSPDEIEGTIPNLLRGKLFRIGPGSKKVFSTSLNHFFDGDGYLTAVSFKNGNVTAQSKFIETDERIAEKAAEKMLYHDFGTKCPDRSKGFKNPPNIHFVKIGDKHLALSEAAHPYAINPEDLSTDGVYNFKGKLDKDLSFTAHPKLDPFNGDTFAYGISRSLSPKLKVLRISQRSGSLSEITSFSLGGFFPVHDMLLTENYIIFIISPLKVNLYQAALGNKPVAELLEYEKNDPLRILIFSKDGKNAPIEIKSQPSGLVFHNCNAYEDKESGQLILDSIVADDDSAFDLFKHWAQESMPKGPLSSITRFVIDMSNRTLIRREKISDGIPTDFPCIDSRAIGRPMNYYYALEATDRRAEDPLAFDTIVCWDLKTLVPFRVKSEENQVWGEPVFVPHPDSSRDDDHKAWILHLGYDGGRDQTFLDIRSSIRLDLEARVWFGRFIPIGFHGSFFGPESVE